MSNIANLVALAEMTTDMLDEYSIQANHSEPSQIEHPIVVAAWIMCERAKAEYYLTPKAQTGITESQLQTMSLRAIRYLNAINKLTDHVWQACNGASAT